MWLVSNSVYPCARNEKCEIIDAARISERTGRNSGCVHRVCIIIVKPEVLILSGGFSDLNLRLKCVKESSKGAPRGGFSVEHWAREETSLNTYIARWAVPKFILNILP